MAFNSEDKLAMDHAKQALVVAIFFSASATLLYCLSFFAPADLRIFRLVVVLLIYALYLIYAVLCVMGTVQVRQGRYRPFPVFGSYTDRLDL